MSHHPVLLMSDDDRERCRFAERRRSDGKPEVAALARGFLAASSLWKEDRRRRIDRREFLDQSVQTRVEALYWFAWIALCAAVPGHAPELGREWGGDEARCVSCEREIGIDDVCEPCCGEERCDRSREFACWECCGWPWRVVGDPEPCDDCQERWSRRDRR